MRLSALITIAAMAVATCVTAPAKEKADTTNATRQVTVYLSGNMAVDPAIQGTAKTLASVMFSQIGVHIQWRSGNPARPEAGAIVVEFVTDVPSTFKPGALAYALPYEGVHIRILWDRIGGSSYSREILAHVMVHEITHILQGEARHSAEGIMKANWSMAEMASMREKPLRFTAEDVDLIYRGMDTREARTLANSNATSALTTTAAVGVAEK